MPKLVICDPQEVLAPSEMTRVYVTLKILEMCKKVDKTLDKLNQVCVLGIHEDSSKEPRGKSPLLFSSAVKKIHLSHYQQQMQEKA